MPRRSNTRIWVRIAAAFIPLLADSADAALTRWTENGVIDFSYGSTVESSGGTGTAYKPESKLFYTPDGEWWAVLGYSGDQNLSPGVYIWHLVKQDGVTHVWETNSDSLFPSADPWAKADTLFDSISTLWVSLRDNQSLAGNPRVSNLYSFIYDGNGNWILSTGPTQITKESGETLTIALDSAARIWATWRSATNVKVAYWTPGMPAFSAPMVLSNTTGSTPVTKDDISAVTAFGTAETGFKIGVMWSDQNLRQFWFAWRLDAADPADPTAWNFQTPYGSSIGSCATAHSDKCADDHINLKVNGDDVYAVVKTSLNDPCRSGAAIYPACLDDPLIVILHRDALGGWSDSVVAKVRSKASRPILLLAPSLDIDQVYVAAEIDFKGIYLWSAQLSTLGVNTAFSAAQTFIRTTPLSGGTSLTANVLDPTSTKQPITSAFGTVVEASYGHQYLHNELLTSP